MSYLARETKGTWLDGDNPTLSSEHIDRIRQVATVRSVKHGEILYEPSEPTMYRSTWSLTAPSLWG